MTYSLTFHPDALDEWQKIDKSIKEQFKKILKRRLQNPQVPKSKLRGDLKDCYKIKLKKSGYRLVYQVKDKQLLLIVIAVGKREKNLVYATAYLRE